MSEGTQSGMCSFIQKKLKKVQWKGMEHKDIEMFKLNHI